ncbi:MAG: hypothetical protein KJO55_02595 [Gammaproteobacteria bacterium]|nr:hypothetical protein [Gammaproteobacteria bacterium]NND59681.1 hypothetical protein [Gammaproteobacteria bacterium]
MKMRIKGDSLRLRLTQTEVAELASGGACSVTMNLAQGALTYKVCSGAVDNLSAGLEHDLLQVTVPRARIMQWAQSDEVTISGQHGPLQILVEKDFACLKPRPGDDDLDTFRHPGAPLS